MATNKTANLGLNDWVGTDAFRREELNENFRKLDGKAKEHADAIADNAAQLSDIATNVKAKGAKGDGTDETTVLQNILNLLAGQVLLLPFGSSFKINTLTVPDNTVIIGYGAKLYNTTTHQTLLSLGNGVKIYGLEIEGAGNSALNYSGHGIDFKGADSSNYKENVLLEDCHIHGFGGYGVFLQFVKDVMIHKCRIENIGYAGIHGLSVTNVTVDKVIIKGISPGTGTIAYGLAFTRTATTNDLTTYPRSKDCKITNCVVEDNPLWEGLDTHAGDNIIFANNTIRNCKIGIAVVPSGVNDVDDRSPINCKVIDNTIYGNGTGYGVSCTGAVGTIGSPTENNYGSVVKGNTLINCGENGNNISGAIYVHSTLGLVVSNNTLKDCYGHGINIYKDNRGFSVTGNTVIDVQDSLHTVPSGIVVRDRYNFGVIDGNNIYKVNVSLNTYVMPRGIFVQATANLDITLGTNQSTADSPIYNNAYTLTNHGYLGNGKAKILSGNNSPEGVFTADIGSLFLRLNGAAGTTFYIKESGNGTNTGWVAK